MYIGDARSIIYSYRKSPELFLAGNVLCAMYRIVTAPVWTNSLKCPRTEEAFIGSRAQPETQ